MALIACDVPGYAFPAARVPCCHMLPSSSSLLPPSLQHEHKSAFCICEPIASSMSDTAPSMHAAKTVEPVHQIVGAIDQMGSQGVANVRQNVAALFHTGNHGIGIAWQPDFRDSLLGKKPPPLPALAPG